MIDEDPSFSDQTELTSQIARVAASDAFPTINGRNTDARFKREASRRRRDCNLSAKHCETLLNELQSYLMDLKNKFAMANGGKSPLSEDILKCLECKKLINDADENVEYHTPRAEDQYLMHDYAEQNSPSNFDTAVKLLDDAKAENGSKRTEVNRTEATKIQLLGTDTAIDNRSQSSTNQSLKDISVSETITVSIDHIESNESRRINESDANNSSINDKQPDSNHTANDSNVINVIKIQDDKNIPVTLKVDQQRVTFESRDVTSVRPWPTTQSSNTKTQYSATTKDNEYSGEATVTDSIGTTTETATGTIDDLTKQIIKNTPAGYDVTRIADQMTVQPLMRPSFERHPENRSTAATNGTCSGIRREEIKEIFQSFYMSGLNLKN